MQLARQAGYRILATASGKSATSARQKTGRARGARRTIGRCRREAAASRAVGLNAVLAFAGGEGLERCLDFVNKGGRVVFPNGVEPAPKPRRTFKIKTYDGEASPASFAELGRRLVRAKVRVPIAAVYPLGGASKAHRRLAKGHIDGRIVLQVHRL